MLPGPYYQSELKRAEANLRLALSHGPRLRRAVRRLRLGCAEARVRLMPFGLPRAPSRQAAPPTEPEPRLAAARLGLRGTVDPEGELVSTEVEDAVWEELRELQSLLEQAGARFNEVPFAPASRRAPDPRHCSPSSEGAPPRSHPCEPDATHPTTPDVKRAHLPPRHAVATPVGRVPGARALVRRRRDRRD